MRIEDVQKVLIVGAGTMGQQIGFVCALHGYEVLLYDAVPDTYPQAFKRIQRLAAKFVASGQLKAEGVEAVLGRIRDAGKLADAAREADIVSESVPEDPELKGKVFAQLNEYCPPHTIFTTNTSSLVPSMFAEKTGRPEKFAAFHFHDCSVTRIVDIMPHPGTSTETVELIKAFAKRIGQVAIVLEKENFGYVFNAMLMEFMKVAQTLAAREVASVEDIDRSWMGVMHTPAGPFGIMDSIGLDTVWKVTDYWAGQTKDPQAIANADFLKRYIDGGKLGIKSGQGFYTYPDPAFLKPDFISGN
jgi:3-hydroxybutyryl-CoA dehydrogenase